MSGHSKWHNIQHKKGAADAARSGLFTKLAREITMAAKLGDKNPDNNPRLRLAILTARKNSMPNDNIKRAIEKASGPLCAGTCLGCSPAWLWPGLARFRRETSGLQGPPLPIRHGPCLHDTSPRGRHSAGSDGQTQGMIYNPFQGITAPNGKRQFVLPQGGRAKSINGESNVARPVGRVWPDIRQ